MTFLLKRFSYHCSYRWKFMKLGWKLPVFKALANWKALKFFLRTERVLIPRMKSDCLSLESFNFATVHTSFRWHRSGWFNPSYDCLSTPVREELKVSCALVLKGTRRRIDITREGWALKGELGEIMLEMIKVSLAQLQIYIASLKHVQIYIWINYENSSLIKATLICPKSLFHDSNGKVRWSIISQ